MNTKSKLVILAFIILLSSSLMAQGKKKKKQMEKEVETVQIVAVDDVVEIMSADEMVESVVSNSFEPLNSIRYNSKFEIYGSINDKYDFYCEKYAKDKYNSIGIADKNGNVILPHLFGKRYNNSSNFEVVLNMNRNYGLFNLNELRWSIPMEYEELEDLGNNLFSAKRNGKWGVVDNNNAVIVPFDWYEISTISNLENYLIVTTNTYPNKLKGIYSLVERKLTVPAKYSSLKKLENQNYFLVNDGSKYNIVDISNNPRLKKWYDDITIPSRGRNYLIVKLDNRFGVIDDNENVVIPIEYIEFSTYPYSDGSYLARNKVGKYGFILIDGRITLPFEYDNLTRKYNDNVVSVQNGKCGLVQVNAGVPYAIVTCDYDDIKAGNKTFIVEKAGKFGLLDIYGKLITEIEFQSLEALVDESSNMIIFKGQKEGQYQLINEQGKPISSDKYSDIASIIKKSRSYYYSNKFTYLKARAKTGKYCIIDKVGKTITKPIFDDVLSENENLVIVKSNGKQALYSILDQKFILDYDYDQIVKTADNYYGISDKKIDILVIKSGEVTKVATTK